MLRSSHPVTWFKFIKLAVNETAFLYLGNSAGGRGNNTAKALSFGEMDIY